MKISRASKKLGILEPLPASIRQVPRKIIVTALSLIIIALGLRLARIGQPWTGTVLAVTAGNSLVIMRGRDPYQVRLWGIGCPGTDQPLGREAREFLLRRAKGQKVRVRMKGEDRQGRKTAVIEMPDGGALHLELLQAGLARWDKDRAPNCRECAEAEEEARRNKVGVWRKD